MNQNLINLNECIYMLPLLDMQNHQLVVSIKNKILKIVFQAILLKHFSMYFHLELLINFSFAHKIEPFLKYLNHWLFQQRNPIHSQKEVKLDLLLSLPIYHLIFQLNSKSISKLISHFQKE